MEHTLDSYLKNKLKTNKDMTVRQFQSISYLDLLDFHETIEGLADLDPDVRRKTDRVGDCCLLTFFENGLSHLIPYLTMTTRRTLNTTTVSTTSCFISRMIF